LNSNQSSEKLWQHLTKNKSSPNQDGAAFGSYRGCQDCFLALSSYASLESQPPRSVSPLDEPGRLHRIIEEFGINPMSEVIPLKLQISAVVLAQELKFSAAAEKLGINPAILRAQIGELATRLECPLFEEEGDRVKVTKDGQVLINAFRSFLAQRGRLQE
jgi:hypothetical protein